MKKSFIFSFSLLFTGCALSFVPYPNGLLKSHSSIKQDINKNKPYRNYHVFTGINVASKTLDEVLDELSSIENKNYIYMSGYQIAFPSKLDIYVSSFVQLKRVVEEYTPFTLEIKKRPYNTYIVVAKVKDDYKITINKTKGKLIDLLKEIADAYQANLIIEGGTFTDKELGELQFYKLLNKTVFDLKQAISSYNNIFIEYNPYNDEVKVYKYKYLKKIIRNLTSSKVKNFLKTLLVYDSKLEKPNSFYIDKTGLLIVKTTYLNYYNVLQLLNMLEKIDSKSLVLEFDILKVVSIDKIPYYRLRKDIENCGNFECVKEVVQNYGELIDFNRYFSAFKLNKPSSLVTNKNNNKLELDFKVFPVSLKDNRFELDYTLFSNDTKEKTYIKTSLNIPLYTFEPIFYKRTENGNRYIQTYFIARIFNDNSL